MGPCLLPAPFVTITAPQIRRTPPPPTGRAPPTSSSCWGLMGIAHLRQAGAASENQSR